MYFLKYYSLCSQGRTFQEAEVIETSLNHVTSQSPLSIDVPMEIADIKIPVSNHQSTVSNSVPFKMFIYNKIYVMFSAFFIELCNFLYIIQYVHREALPKMQREKEDIVLHLIILTNSD